MGRVWLAAALVGVGLGLFALILALIGPGAVWAQVQGLGPWGFLSMLGNDLAATALWVGSWGVLLHAFGVRLRPSQTAGIGVAGFAVSYITPVAYAGGEPVRAWLVSRKAGATLTTAFATLFVDRLLAGLSLVLFALLGGAFTLTGDLLPPARIQVALGLFALALAVALGVLSFARNYHWLSRLVASLGRLRRAWTWPSAWGRSIRAMEDEMHQAFTRLLPWTLLAFVLQLGSFFCTYLRPALFFFFTEGRRFSLPDLAVYFNLNAILTTLLWLTPAGLGTAEGGRVGILTLLGVSPQGGMAFSLTVRFLELLLVLAGLLYLSREGLLRIRAGPLRPGVRARRAARFLRGTLEVGLLLLWAAIPSPARQRLLARRFRTPDPWGYAERPYEKRKYELKLAILPRKPNPSDPPYTRVLELGCAEGLFTCRLAQAGVGREIIGVDFVPQALERAKVRCPTPQVKFLLLDITTELPPGEFDLIYCSEVLYYLGSSRRIRDLAHRLCAQLSSGGHVVLVGPWPAERVFHRPFTAHPELEVVARHVEREASRPYAITCLEKRGEGLNAA